MEPNRFGTTQDMVIEELDVHGVRKVMAIDDKGLYLTNPERVGRNMADTNRYGVSRQEFKEILETLGYNTEAIFRENRHRIPDESAYVSQERKVNPLKASKRGE